MRHHYVPQFLLRPWEHSTQDRTIEVFRLDLDRLSSSRHTPKYTGFQNDLYALTMEEVAGMDQHAVEKLFLKQVDNFAAIIRDKLDNEGFQNLSLDERKDWVIFLMSLRLRQPDIIQMLRQGAEEQLRENMARQPYEYEELAGVNDPSTLEEWTERQYPGLIENFGLSIFPELVNNQDIGNQILNMRWWLWDFSDIEHDLLIADHPCIFTTGINDPNLVVALPITPKKVFMATQSEAIARHLRAQRSRVLVTRINESSISQARIRIYARNTSPRRFIMNRLR